MTARLESLAAECGVEVISCDPCWGGRFGYKTADQPNIEICGYRTKNAALIGWLDAEFSGTVGEIVRRRLGL